VKTVVVKISQVTVVTRTTLGGLQNSYSVYVPEL